jgi:tRNA threonylcarbamoyladenosine biosynthesis protein TsaB
VKLLAFDTSTETLRIAVQSPSGVRARESAGGAQASTTLIPAIRELLSEAGLELKQLDAVVFGRGPGSFTGVRTACSVAQGLAFGGGLAVLPVDTLLAVAEDARQGAGHARVVAVLDARMDEVYLGRYEWDGTHWIRGGPPVLASPEDVEVPAGWVLAGNASNVYAGRLAPSALHVAAAPSATALLHLAPFLMKSGQGTTAQGATPVYIRDKVAQTTEERAAARASRQGNA